MRVAGLLMALTAAGVAIDGYHYGIEDEAIYLPAIKAHLDPALYPHDAVFFQLQTRPMLFDELVAATARMLHAPVEWTVFGYYLVTLLLFLAGAWAVQSRLFSAGRARCGGLLPLTALLTLPVAGTCVFLVDQHLHPRTLATALILFAVARLMPRAWGGSVSAADYAWVVLFTVASALMHPQMAFYGALLMVALWLPERLLRAAPALASAVVAALLLVLVAHAMGTGGAEWQEASRTRTQHYLLQWEWYEWLGAIAPVFVLLAISAFARSRGLAEAAAVARRTAWFAAAGFAAGCLIAIPPQMERLTPYQPLRTLHLTYLVMTLLAGGLLGEFALRDKPWRWAALLLPIVALMSWAQFDSFPASHHIEWPGRATGNDWVEAFDWVKTHTPVDAYFVLDPHYMSREGEDFHGFRGLAERSQMADWDKDPGVALLFPALVERWWHEVHALDGWENFRAADLHRLREQYGVDWTVLPAQGKGSAEAMGMSHCPYRNRSVVVCRIDE
jgi:hypothetical protein